MTAESPHLSLLWRYLDGEPLDASEQAILNTALATDSGLREHAALHRQMGALLASLAVAPAPEALATTISQGIATPPPVAEILLFGLPLQRFALVATLLLAVLAGAYGLRPEPMSHETALMREHVAAVQAQTTFLPLLSSVTADPEWLDMRGFQLPGGSVTLAGQRDCTIIDCPATQFFGTHWSGIPLSIFVVDHDQHFELDGYVLAAGGAPKHDYGVMRSDSTTMVAWKQDGRLFGLVANMAPGDLIALAENGRVVGAIDGRVPYTVAWLRGHTIQ